MSDVQATDTKELQDELKDPKGLGYADVLRIWKSAILSHRERRKLEKFLQPYHDKAAKGSLDRDDSLVYGLTLFVIGRSFDSLEPLTASRANRVAAFALTHAFLDTGRAADARETIEKLLEKEGQDPILSSAYRAALEATGDLAKLADQIKKAPKGFDHTAEGLYYQGLLQEADGNVIGAVSLYEQSIAVDPEYPRALFRLAYHSDRMGDDDRAMELYERCTDTRPTHVNAFLNLGVLYEDEEDYASAGDCYRAVLDAFPTHPRAILYFKDAESSKSMHYDEDQEKREDKRNQILQIPVTDFELSVRSRNCLEKMKIRTLGDLIKKSEPELLSYKNFGETSLAEIKEILGSKGLHLGMGRDEDIPLDVSMPPEPRFAKPPSHTAEGGVLARPVSDLDLSIRARRAMEKLGLESLGQLVQKTEKDLLECRNFGETSLKEVRTKLTQLGLKLRPSAEE
ncbi:MAG: tetratricopeptide repeat protein [Planctomycetes bacterium]|nr:tetratricopeptide repeat protein [Planctomycetota bacterium]MBI3847493.1 tetratricopeptide repeat protein [Planctomycetota bacterium]